jgi:uncharacterized 2Fe-2S/4Fe-4S cluster protein (DUF4445 family)
MPKEYRVTFLPLDRVMQAEEGQSVLEFAMRAGVHINASCGGNGVCGKCKIMITEGAVASTVSQRISQTEYDEGARLACQTIVTGDVVIQIPLESQIDKSTLKKTAQDTHISSDFQMDELFKNIHVKPLVPKVYVELPEPTPEDNVSDFDRLIRELGNSLPEGNISAPHEIIREFGKMVRESRWKITVTVMYCDDDFKIICIEPGNRTNDIYSIAIDIGTTTVCGRLIDVSASSSQLTAYGGSRL